MVIENIKAIFSSDKPITGKQKLTGVAKADVLFVQSRDAKGENEVSIVFEVNGKRFGMPKRTWDSMGVPHDWLDEQIERARHPVRARLRDAVGRLGRMVG